MSIIMPGAGSESSEARLQAPEVSTPLVELLDHLAAELAAEYVQLMEKAAEGEQVVPSPPEGGTP